jgi:putative toxin-antitoxin system antitoxin component (TIGR02293 family)
MKNLSLKKPRPYVQTEEPLSRVEETVSPLYQRGGLGHALAILGLQQPDSLLDTPTDFDLVDVIRKGLSKKAMDVLMAHMDISAIEMSRMLHTSDRTMRRYTDDSVLNPEQSERLIELARLFAHGIDVFGSADRFRRWINGPVYSLGGQQPINLMDTSLGISLVNDTLGRIEHGIVG